MCNFAPNGLITGPNAPRPTQIASGFSCYDAVAVAQIDNSCGSLRERNARHYRINDPDGTGAVPGIPVRLACHHVIGWDVIWGFWNALIGQGDYKLARAYLAICGVAQTKTAKLEKSVKRNSFNAGANWDAKLCWNPINLVRGPEDRSDDPNGNNNLVDKIDFQRAPSDVYGGRVATLVQIGRAMCVYIGNPAGTAKAKDAIKKLTALRGKEIMEWDESLWVVNKDMPNYSSTPALGGGFLVVNPTWKITTS